MKVQHALAVWIGAVALSSYVVASGIHGSAWTATIKDVLTLSVVVSIGLYLPIHYFGSIGRCSTASRTRSPASPC
jgi:solute:Na+ symporter, SSS family